MSTLVEAVQAAAKAIREDYREKNQDGISAIEAIQLFYTAANSLVVVAQTIGGTGSEKLNAVVDALMYLYETILAPIDLPWIPNFIEPVVDRKIAEALRPILAGFVEGAVAVAKKLNIPGFTAS